MQVVVEISHALQYFRRNSGSVLSYLKLKLKRVGDLVYSINHLVWWLYEGRGERRLRGGESHESENGSFRMII